MSKLGIIVSISIAYVAVFALIKLENCLIIYTSNVYKNADGLPTVSKLLSFIYNFFVYSHSFTPQNDLVCLCFISLVQLLM